MGLVNEVQRTRTVTGIISILCRGTRKKRGKKYGCCTKRENEVREGGTHSELRHFAMKPMY